MDLKQVITELRTELESIDQVIASLEKLGELRTRRTAAVAISESEAPVRRARGRKSSGARESTSSASASGSAE